MLHTEVAMHVSEWPLVLFTILASMAVGSFVTLGAVQLVARRQADVKTVDDLSDPAVYAIGPVMVLSIGVAFFHLGNPINALHVVGGLGHSWLSWELFFGAEAELTKHLDTMDQAARGEVKVVILSLRRARNPDAVFLIWLRTFWEGLRARGVALLLCGVQPDLLNGLSSTGLRAAIGEQHIFGEDAAGNSSESKAVRFATGLHG